MARKIVITSGKGGVGKTTITTNLGVVLAKHNYKVLIMDVDFGLNNLDVVLGVENRVVYDIIDIIKGKCRAKQALIQDFFYPNLYILPSVNSLNNLDITSEQLNYIIDQIEHNFDFILIDSPAGIDIGFYRAVKCANEALVVTTPHISAIRDADKVINILNSFDEINSIKVLVNRVRGDLIINGDMFSEQTIKEFLKVELLGVIPEDDAISTTLLVGGSVEENTEAYKSYEMLIDNLIYNKQNIYDYKKRYKGIFGNFRKRIRKIL